MGLEKLQASLPHPPALGKEARPEVVRAIAEGDLEVMMTPQAQSAAELGRRIGRPACSVAHKESRASDGSSSPARQASVTPTAIVQPGWIASEAMSR